LAVPELVMTAAPPARADCFGSCHDECADNGPKTCKGDGKDGKPDSTFPENALTPAVKGTMAQADEVSRQNKSWQEGRAKTVTFIVTEDCQLRCKYCYIVEKKNTRRMDFEVARAAADYLLRERERFREKSVVFDFIGGEPFLEIDLIDRICDYVKLRMFEQNHPWFDSYRFSFSTNGLMYGKDKVQRFVAKNREHLSIGISIDGTRRKHDSQRIFPNGKGSYDRVVGNIPLWLAQFPNASTKATVAHDDLPFVKDSVAHLFDLGIKTVNINVVFENVWQEGDDAVFEAQLKALADHIIDNRLYRDRHCSFFNRSVGKPIDRKDDRNWCGAGKMLAVDADGNFYPCVRFAPYSLSHRAGRRIGNCYDGIDDNKLRPFLAMTRKTQSTEECLNCEVAGGCAWCSGCNYDLSDDGTIFQRATYLCKMHKARVRANAYYWNKLDALENEKDR
jgi:uncharacterized protein